jgi:hypothetical protein
VPRLQFEYKVTVANVIQITLILVGGFWAYATIVSAQAQATTDLAKLKPDVVTLQQTDATFNTRLTVVESRAETTDKQINVLLGSIDKLVDQMNADRVSSAQIRTDVGYLRDWVESLKREARSSP